MLNIFFDRCAENDIQLLDQEVVKTINQLPAKNQQLRVFDSFVGYQTDVIELRVGKACKVNEAYIVKSKGFKTMKLISILSFILGTLFFAFEVVALVLEWKFSFILHLAIIVFALLFFVASFLFLTRATILFRAGEEFDAIEMKEVMDKCEKYNFKG